MARNYDFPVWGTQGGGLVRWLNGVYVFVEAPAEGTNLFAGDIMPSEWSTAPANELAREQDLLSDF